MISPYDISTHAMTFEEKGVWKLLVKHAHGANCRFKQRDIALICRELGSHPVHEQPQFETTMRLVRKIVHDLRSEHGCPIVSDIHGYWIPTDMSEVVDYLERIERTAKSQSAAWFKSYDVAKNTYGVKNKFFERQRRMF